MARCQAVTNRRWIQDHMRGLEYECVEICMCEALEAVDGETVRMVNLCAAHKAMAERAAIEVTVGRGKIAEFRV